MTEPRAAAAETGSKPRSNAWFVLFVLMLVYTFNYADRYLISGLVDPIKAEFGLGDQFMGLLMGPAFALLYTTAAIPIARLADRRNRIAIICIGCLVWSVFTGLSGSAVDKWTLALARVGVGIGEAAFIAPAYSVLSDYFRPERRGMAFAVLGLAIYFGQMTGYAAGPLIADMVGSWRAAFHTMAVPGIVLAGIAWLFVREPARTNARTGAAVIGLKPLLAMLSRAPAYIFMMLALGLGSLSGVSFGFWGPTLFARQYGVPLTEASGAFALYFGSAGLTGTLLFGWVADRLARGGMARPLMLAAGALFAATLFILLVTMSDSFRVARWLAIPSGLLGGGWSIGVMASLQYLLPDRVRATGTALFIMMTTIMGFCIGPWLTGVLSEMLGDDADSLRLALVIVIPTGFVGGLCALLAVRRLMTDRTALGTLDL